MLEFKYRGDVRRNFLLKSFFVFIIGFTWVSCIDNDA